MPDVRIRVGDAEHTGVERLVIRKSLESPVHTFDLDIADPQPRAIPPGAKIEILDGSDLVLTGYAGKPKWRRTRSGRTLTLAGRSPAGDLYDCCRKPNANGTALPGVYSGLTLLGLAQAMSAGYPHVMIYSDVDDLSVLPDVVVRPTEKIYQVLEREARPLGLLLLSDAAGSVAITRPGMLRAPDVLQVPDVEEIGCGADLGQRYDTVEALGQTVGDDASWGLDAQYSATSNDLARRRGRHLVIECERPSDAQASMDRALYEQAVRAAKSVEADALLSGWRWSDGTLIEPGWIVRCFDDWMGLDADLIVRDVELRAGAKVGTGATLALTRREAYLPEPRKPRKAKKVRAKGGALYGELTDEIDMGETDA